MDDDRPADSPSALYQYPVRWIFMTLTLAAASLRARAQSRRAEPSATWPASLARRVDVVPRQTTASAAPVRASLCRPACFSASRAGHADRDGGGSLSPAACYHRSPPSRRAALPRVQLSWQRRVTNTDLQHRSSSPSPPTLSLLPSEPLRCLRSSSTGRSWYVCLLPAQQLEPSRLMTSCLPSLRRTCPAAPRRSHERDPDRRSPPLVPACRRRGLEAVQGRRRGLSSDGRRVRLSSRALAIASALGQCSRRLTRCFLARLQRGLVGPRYARPRPHHAGRQAPGRI